MAKEYSREIAGTKARCADSKQKNVRNAKGSCTVVATMATVRAIQAMAAQARL